MTGGVYRVFIAQTKAYTVQDQVVEVQQDIRSAMEIVARDLRMGGFQTSTFNSSLITNSPIVYPLSDSTITVNYEYLGGALPATYTVTYTGSRGKFDPDLNADPDSRFSYHDHGDSTPICQWAYFRLRHLSKRKWSHG